MLLDTSGLLCLLHKPEPYHVRASQLYKAATVRVTHSLVLAEFVALGTARGLPRTAVLKFLMDLLANPDIEMVWADQRLGSQALTHLLARLDKSYSMCDAVSFMLMRQRGLTDALTTDHHFEQEGFRRLLQ